MGHQTDQGSDDGWWREAWYQKLQIPQVADQCPDLKGHRAREQTLPPANHVQILWGKMRHPRAENQQSEKRLLQTPPGLLRYPPWDLHLEGSSPISGPETHQGGPGEARIGDHAPGGENPDGEPQAEGPAEDPESVT